MGINAQRQAARKFVEYWTFNRPGSEKSGCQQYWNMLLGEVLGMSDLAGGICYETIFGKDWKNAGNLDYVTCWYKKTADYMLANGGMTRAAFVSTNSICQGDGVATLWRPLFEMGVEIDYAWRTFCWNSESSEKAHVHVVIVGFRVNAEGRQKGAPLPFRLASREATASKWIFFDGSAKCKVRHINGYLTDGPDVFAESRRETFSDLPLVFGSMPNDGGFLSNYDEAQKAAIVYNNFPWPNMNDGCEGAKQGGTVVEPILPTIGVKPKIEHTAQAILDARALYPESSLADLYDPLTMPPELRKAHAANDAAVMKAYGFPEGLTEPEIVSRLFDLYEKLTSAGERVS